MIHSWQLSVAMEQPELEGPREGYRNFRGQREGNRGFRGQREGNRGARGQRERSTSFRRQQSGDSNKSNRFQNNGQKRSFNTPHLILAPVNIQRASQEVRDAQRGIDVVLGTERHCETQAGHQETLW